MPFNGSGTFNRTFPSGGWQGDAAANIKIKADRHDQHDADLASGLSNVICKDGQSSPTADIPFNSKKITGLADPVNNQDAVTKNYMLGAAATQGLFTKVGFASADMSLLGRAAGSPAGTLQRIAYNDKADGTGNDVFVVNDDGTVSARAADGTYKQFAPMTAEARNRIVNGAMQISQENGNTGGTAAGYYPADQWLLYASSSSTITAGRAPAAVTTDATPAYSIYLSPSVNETTATAGEYAQFVTYIEGIRLYDFCLGTAQSRAFVLSFSVNVSVAGTYWISINNASNSHTWLSSYTVSAGEQGTWVRKQIAVPAGGINAGTWNVTTAIGMQIHFVFHDGGTAGTAGFQTGGPLAGPGQALGLSAGACYLGNVGLYLDPGATGIAPKWQMPDEAEELQACQRYYYNPGYTGNPTFAWLGAVFAFSATLVDVFHLFPVPMRTTPGCSVSTVISVMGATGAGVNGSISAFNLVSPVSVNGRYAVPSGFGAGQTGYGYSNPSTCKFAINARM